MGVIGSYFLVFLVLSMITSSSLVIDPQKPFTQAFAQSSDESIRDLGNYVVFGFEKVELKNNVIVTSGNVGVQKENSEVKIKENVSFEDPNSTLVGDKVEIDIGALVNDVYYNELENKGTIGSENSPLSLPIIDIFPSIPDLIPRDESITVERDQILLLSPGQYDKIKVKKGATLIFEGGEYSVSSFKAEKETRILFDAASTLIVQDKIKVGERSFFGPSESSEISAADILIFAVGEEKTSDDGEMDFGEEDIEDIEDVEDFEDTKKTKVEFKKESIVFANIYAPNGEIKIKKETQATGAFVANKVKVDKDSTLTLDSQFGITVLIEELEETLKELDALFLLIEQDSDAEIFELADEKIEKVRSLVAELESSGITVEVEVVESSPLKLIIKLIKNSHPIIKKTLIVLKTLCGITAVTGVSEYYTDVLTIPDLASNHEKNALAIIIANVCEKAPQDAFDSNPESIPQVQRFLENIGQYLIGKGSPFDVANVLNQPFIRAQILDVANKIINIYSLLLDQAALAESVIANISAMIMGVVFDDKNANQVQDGIEGTLSDWKITLTDLETNLLLETTKTNLNGEYMFPTAATAFTEVKAEIRPGTEQTLPDPSGLTGGTYQVNVMSKSFAGETTILDFGNRLIIQPQPIPAFDIVSVNEQAIVTDNTFVSVVLGDGAGGFSASSAFDAGLGFASETALGDFNNDGNVDAILAILQGSSGPRNLSLVLGDGTGAFGPPSFTTTTGKFPVGIASGDFNNDGNLDGAFINNADRTLSVLLGDGVGGFGPENTFSTGHSLPPQEMAVGDFNNDGNDDVVVALLNANVVSVFIADGTGGFNPRILVNIGGLTPNDVETTDFNGDGFDDFVVSNSGTFTMSVNLFDDTTGGFVLSDIVSTGGGSPRSVSTGDFNNDGDEDVVTLNGGSRTFSIFLGDGTGNFVRFSVPSIGSSLPPISVVVADFDRDGNDDLATGLAIGNGMLINLGDGTGSFGSPTLFSLGPSNNRGILQVTDLNP